VSKRFRVSAEIVLELDRELFLNHLYTLRYMQRAQSFFHLPYISDSSSKLCKSRKVLLSLLFRPFDLNVFDWKEYN
jgi:hypothetical protein